MKIVVVSESAFTVQGHGVHTAYIETVNALKTVKGLEVTTNNWRRADVRHIHTVGPYALGQLLFARGKKVVSAHVLPESFVGSLVGTRYWLWAAKLYLRWYYNRADTVVAVSDATQDGLRKLGVRTPIATIYNMIDTSYYRVTPADKAAARKALGYSSTDWIVVGNGQVQPRKRIATFVECARRLPDMKFVWVGGMPFEGAAADYRAMKHIIDHLPTNMIITGVVPRTSVREYFAASDAFMLPSEQETFGLAVIEAGAADLPIVLRDIHDYDTTFRGNALMCGDDDGFVEALESLKDDPELFRRYRTLARELAQRYDSQVIVRQLVDVYRNLL